MVVTDNESTPQTLEEDREMSRFIGVDLHKNMFVVSFYEEQSGKHKLWKYRLTEIGSFKRRLKKTDILGVESTGNTRYFVDQIRDCVEQVRVINPSQFKVISHSVKKTDDNDAKVIAEFLSKDMVPEVRMKDAKTAQVSSLANTRDKLVKLRTALKNKIHNILSAHGIILKKEVLASKKALKEILDQPVNSVALVELKVIVEQIESLNEGISKLDKELEEQGKKLDGHENITSIKGIGDKSGSILLSVIGDIDDFENEKKLAAYFGIVPRVSNSNEKEHQGRITKRGSKLGRTTLVQCTLVAIRYSPYLNGFYQRIKARKGSGKAIIATAKKLLGIIYLTLKNKWVFEDFPNFVLKAG
jgi:transposase